MTDHPSTAGPDHNRPVLSVGELSQALKRHIEGRFEHTRVRGEITGFRRAASGHLYFSLKDQDAVLDAVCWRGTAGRLSLQPEDGVEVIADGRVTTYPGRSKYQIVVEAMEMAGEGALLKLLEERRRRLAAEGLFDADRKAAIPFLPEVIGVVTSPTGAVIRDILHRLEERFPCHVLLWPVLVQGEGAAEQVATAIDGFNGLVPGGPVPRPDVLIVARGGGSLEDLWAFNEEVVVRAAAASAIPLISAVGHETDTTLIDFAADLRAPTPTAAAEKAVPVRLELAAQAGDMGARLVAAINRQMGDGRSRLEGLARGLPRPGRMVEEAGQRLDDWAERLANALATGLDRRRARVAEAAARLVSPAPLIDHGQSRLAAETRALDAAVKARMDAATNALARSSDLLDSLSYTRVLERGYVLARDEAGHLLTSAGAIRPGVVLGLTFHDGEVRARAEGDAPPAKPRRTTRRPADDDQGSLL